MKDYGEIYKVLPEPELKRQASRCMGCGVPFCNHACPLGNLIPDWNDLTRTGRWREAIDQLHATNNFPEFTGLVCPAPCEDACVLDINDDPVTIKQIEYAIIENAWEEGWVKPNLPETRTGYTVGVIGSGPAGLAAAQELNAVGHEVTVYERDEAPGGLIRFGVPDAKLEKWIVDRRVGLLEMEGSTSSRRTPGPACRPTSFARATTRSSSRPARGSRASSTCPAASSTASTSRWTTSTSATATSPRSQRTASRALSPRSRSSPRARTWS